MEFRFLLNGVEIPEPVGFDDFKPVIERTDHHGMSVSVSLDKVGFYGNALGIIQEAYDTDIDTELPLILQIKRPESDWEAVYKGVVDLATYELQNGDEGCRINCSVGEIGVKTTFNNRYDTKVELNRDTSLDGDILPDYPMLKKGISMPGKSIKYTVKGVLEQDNTISTLGYNLNKISIPFGFRTIDELNTYVERTELREILREGDPTDDDIFFKNTNEEFRDIKYRIRGRIRANIYCYQRYNAFNDTFYISINQAIIGMYTVVSEETERGHSASKDIDIEFDREVNIPLNSGAYAIFSRESQSGLASQCDYTIKQCS